MFLRIGQAHHNQYNAANPDSNTDSNPDSNPDPNPDPNPSMVFMGLTLNAPNSVKGNKH